MEASDLRVVVEMMVSGVRYPSSSTEPKLTCWSSPVGNCRAPMIT